MGGLKIDTAEIQTMLDMGQSIDTVSDELQQVIKYLQSFAEESQLKGKTWSAAKNVSSQEYTPLFQKMVTYNTQVKTGNKKVQTALDAYPHSGQLDESALEEAIKELQQAKANASSEFMQLLGASASEDMPDAERQANESARSYWQGVMAQDDARIQKLKQYIKDMHLFASGVSGAYDEAKATGLIIAAVLSSLGPSGSKIYQEGSFTLSKVATVSLLQMDNLKKPDGMSQSKYAIYKVKAIQEVASLKSDGWSTGSVNAYIGALNKGVKDSSWKKISNKSRQMLIL